MVPFKSLTILAMTLFMFSPAASVADAEGSSFELFET
jgi:hypothetical protein